MTRASDDPLLAEAVAAAPVPALLAALAQQTGDLGLLRADWRPDPEQLIAADGGLAPGDAAEARRAARGALAAALDRDGPPRAVGPDELRELLTFVTGDTGTVEAFLPLLREELAVGDEDPRAPDWHLDEIAPGADVHVVVVGAGMSGLLAAHRCRQAGLPVTVFDRNPEVGGTWWENTYPGCRVDVPNHLYSYSFRPHDWPQHYSTRDDLLDYFRGFAADHGLYEVLRLATEVVAADFDDADRRWRVRVRGPGGEREVTATAVISAVGQLNRPHVPDLPGRERFAGRAFHTARWDPTCALAGQRVAVIGTGASAVQCVPAVAEEAERVRVFQRTPNWLVPTPDYRDDIPEGLRWLQRRLPGYAAWHRFWLFWKNAEGILPLTEVDDDWDGDPRAVGALNGMLRELLAAHLDEAFAHAPELLAASVPDYAPAAKRPLRDDGTWPATLAREDVDLVTEPIAEITPGGVRTVDGRHHPADVLVYATGFQASRFLTPMRVTGRGGRDLHAHWAGDARAHLGVHVPGFPNLFCLYGPNTNIVINGSIIYFSECAVRHVLACLRTLLTTGHRALDVREDAHDAFNAWIDAGNRRRAWGAVEVSSWYRNEHGRVSQNWPYSLLEYDRHTRGPALDDFELLA